MFSCTCTKQQQQQQQPGSPASPQSPPPKVLRPQPQPSKTSAPPGNVQEQPPAQPSTQQQRPEPHAIPAAPKQPTTPSTPPAPGLGDDQLPAHPAYSWIVAKVCRWAMAVLAMVQAAVLWALRRPSTNRTAPADKGPQLAAAEVEEETTAPGDEQRQGVTAAAASKSAAVRTLLLGSHNVRGNTGLTQALEVWRQEGVAVVCVQETFHTSIKLESLRLQMADAGWVIVAEHWASVKAGVAIMMRPELAAAAGQVVMPPERPDGRIAACTLEWGGHRLMLCSVYVPTGADEKKSQDRAQVFKSVAALVAGARAAGLTPVLAGDFNFVEDPAADSASGGGSRVNDADYARRFRAAVAVGLGCLTADGTAPADLPLVDTYRLCQPDGREGTHQWTQYGGGWSRLDRIYLADLETARYVAGASISRLETRSDHKLAVLALADASAPQRPRPEPSCGTPPPPTPPSSSAPPSAPATPPASPSGRDCSQAKQGSCDTFSSRISQAEGKNPRRAGRAPPSRGPAPPSSAAAAASFPLHPNTGSPSAASSSSGAQAAEEQDLSIDLDYVPVLGPVREALCVLVPAMLALALYSYTGRWHGGTWAARVTGFLAAAACASLLRTSLLEREYKAREKAYAALGDGDSRFRPIVAASTHRSGASSTSSSGGHSSQTLTVHVKVKTGNLTAVGAHSSGGDGSSNSSGSGGGSSGGSDGSLPAVHCYHGFGANLGSYKRVQGLMAQALGGVVTAHDMPGFGLTQRPTDMSSYFLTFNGRLGRLVLDYELQQLGLLQPAPASAPTVTATAAEGGGEGTTAASGRQGPIKRILIGHSLGGACAALEAVTDPEGIAGVVLVAPAIFAFPGPEFADVQLTPHRPGGGATGAAEATPAEERRAAAAQAAANLGFEPAGCHVTDPPEVRRLYPRREEPEPATGPGMGKQQPQLERTSSALSRSGSGRRARRGRLLRALGRLAGGLASLFALGVLRLLAPVITLLLRSLVRRRTFWLKGLQQAYYNSSGVTPDIVDSYRMPQLVRGWEAGMVNFLLARLTRPRGGISELFRDALRDTQPAGEGEGDVSVPNGGDGGSITGAAAAATAAAATGTGAAAAAAAGAGLAASAAVADSESSRLTRGAATLPTPPSSPGAVTPSAAASGAQQQQAEEDSDLASRLAALVAARRLPVLLVHGLYDKLVPASNSQRLARMLPPGCCELVLLDRCGHMPQEEMPELFVDLVAEFAGRIPAR
ncbi:hypothetical protein HYH02_011221 [Chlamydomonas schloesseri]|uniref:Endonuclease/exonuclease/phosphatase domain-containing protein n=1 Tax=Chlamydomonas schloesseri TaxID=2026947 RepID=A0A835T555_9CHLO|nr:hypothetical protein HYH02_011221 [Chlamydomonas schloesseri]|eukprot:KAG2437581.1 hypothetical protein HYH02_011221 [Chlamydomonas schloesseri]